MNTIDITYNDMIKKGINQDSQEEVRNYYANLNWSKLLEEAEIINDGINAINNIISCNKYNVSILSHVNSLHEAVEKIKFLRKYFKDMTIIAVPSELSKTEMVHVHDSILIDDAATPHIVGGGNLDEWKNKGGISIRFNRNLQGKGYPVIDKLDQILEIL